MANRLALVTGASTGIGFELATLAARHGCDLIVVANEALIESAADDFRQFETQVESVETDLSTIAGVDRLLTAAGKRPIDLLFANAGVGTGGPFLAQDVANWRHSIDTNVTGTVYLIQKVLGAMVARGEGRFSSPVRSPATFRAASTRSTMRPRRSSTISPRRCATRSRMWRALRSPR